LIPYDYTSGSKKVLRREDTRTIRDLKVTFNIRDTTLGDPHLGTFQIFNCAPDTYTMLTEERILFEFYTGWMGQPPALLFSGEIINSYEIRQGADQIWNIWARDSGFALGEDTLAIDPYNAKEMSDLLHSLDLKWVVTSGVVTVFSATDPTVPQVGDPSTVFKVSPESGLLTRPTLDWVGISLDHVLDPRFTPGGIIQVEPESIQFKFGNEFYVPLDKRRDRRLSKKLVSVDKIQRNIARKQKTIMKNAAKRKRIMPKNLRVGWTKKSGRYTEQKGSPSVQDVVNIHEFGLGDHQSEKSFIRNTIASKQKKWLKYYYKNVHKHVLKVDQAKILSSLAEMGEMIKRDLQISVRRVDLIDTERLINSILIEFKGR